MKVIGLKGASGLGDTIYAYPIAKHYAQKNEVVYIMSDYPELFKTLLNVKVYPHKKINYIVKEDGSKQPIDIRFTYCARKYTPGTSQFKDSCLSAGIEKDIPLSLQWEVKDQKSIENIKKVAKGRKLCIIAAPYEPFGRDDQWGKLLRIKPNIMQDIVNEYKQDVCFVQVGNKYVLNNINNVDINLINLTSVSQLMDLVASCDITISQVGNMLPISECLGKKNFIIYSRKAVESENRFIAAIVPEKVTHYKNLNTSIYDDEEHYIRKFSEAINL
jgi:hypothetical protein